MANKRKKEEKKIYFNSIFPENMRAVITGGDGVEHLEVENRVERGSVGNIYLGEVDKVEPALQAAFINYGGKRNGFLPLHEFTHRAVVARKRGGRPRKGQTGKKGYLKKGDRLIVQVVKDGSPLKGAVLTSYYSVAGRYLVLMLGIKKTGISKRIIDGSIREKARRQVEKLAIPEGMGAIVRTVGANRKLKELREDLKDLKVHWKAIQKKAKEMERPGILYAEQDLVTRVLRDHYEADVSRIIVDTEEAFERAISFFNIYAPRKKDDLFLYRGTAPIFEHYGLEDDISNVYAKKVNLPSGGYLIIDITEAFITVDVNSGKSTSERDVEETATKTNMEAAKEIPRQLRIRDLGGIVVIDFIDMEVKQHRKEVERAVRAAMKDDKAKHDIGLLGKFSVMTLTRQRLGTSPLLSSMVECETCMGRGREMSPPAICASFFRNVLRRTSSFNGSVVKFNLSPSLFEYIANHHPERFKMVEEMTGVKLALFVDFSLGGYSFAESSN